ncbi:DUF4062 domain-containing protein [Polyangium spumosum]|uniref:DUF4062 domain-containing protein n=1 Tax=Polyangium spumosum TaxID=889282 RepID=A0A6N7Q5R1_9BACT|nr:DUF4062 domain-containing protein [Polyangium spumosum]MRG98616.1 DUF4062 domain-containing protein [Polyangium spumosum]
MKQARPKYQVFVSSTYRDLHDARERVTWAILNARHIPAGMENFTATNDRGWETIRRVIDLTDYYVVILAGAYGSIDETTGISWTQREYEYALERGIPVLGFIRADTHITQADVEKDAAKQAKLITFKARLKKQHLVQEWTDAEDLARKVVEALRNHIHDDEDRRCPRPGWYRGDSIDFSSTVADELARLSAENEALRRQVEEVKGGKRVCLELTDAYDNVFVDSSEVAYEVPKYVLNRESAAIVDAVTGVVSSSHSEYERFLDRANRSMTFHARVRNTGNKPAKEVTVDLEFEGCEQVNLVGYEAPSVPEHLRGIAPRWKMDTARHVYIDRTFGRGGKVCVRQRVKNIAPGVAEDLVYFLVRAEAMDANGWSVTCSYSITDADGARTKGSFLLVTQFKTQEALSEEQVAARFK